MSKESIYKAMLMHSLLNGYFYCSACESYAEISEKGPPNYVGVVDSRPRGGAALTFGLLAPDYTYGSAYLKTFWKSSFANTGSTLHFQRLFTASFVLELLRTQGLDRNYFGHEDINQGGKIYLTPLIAQVWRRGEESMKTTGDWILNLFWTSAIEKQYFQHSKNRGGLVPIPRDSFWC